MCVDKKNDCDGDIVVSICFDRPYAEIKKSLIDILEREYFAHIQKMSSGSIIEMSRIEKIDRKPVRELLKRHGIYKPPKLEERVSQEDQERACSIV